MTPAPVSDDRHGSSPSPDPSGTGEGLLLWGTVHATVGGVYHVHLESGTAVEASLRGRLKRQRRTGDRVVIGDRVGLASSGAAWTVEEVAERRTQIVRRGVGGHRAKVVAANLDRVFVVVSVRDPAPSIELVDRLLVVAEASGMHPTLILNKVDLSGAGGTADDMRKLYASVGYDVLLTSAETGEGLEALRRELSGDASALVGPSGVGKSSLLNALDPSLGLRIGELSRKTGRGRHTTVTSRLIPLSFGGMVADTPGFGDVGLWGVAAEEVESCFPEFEPHLGRCRFRGCAHMTEPDCGIREAVESGAIPERRYRSYRALREEAAGSPSA